MADVIFLFASVSGYRYLRFTDLSEGFAEEAVSTRGQVLSLDKRACCFSDDCLENQSIIYTAMIAFRDRSGRQWESSAELQYHAYSAGQKPVVHYLASDPSSIVAGDLKFQCGICRVFRIQFAIVTLICVFFAVGLDVPKGTLIKD